MGGAGSDEGKEAQNGERVKEDGIQPLPEGVHRTRGLRLQKFGRHVGRARRVVGLNLKRTSAATQIFTQTRLYENIPHVRS